MEHSSAELGTIAITWDNRDKYVWYLKIRENHNKPKENMLDCGAKQPAEDPTKNTSIKILQEHLRPDWIPTLNTANKPQNHLRNVLTAEHQPGQLAVKTLIKSL